VGPADNRRARLQLKRDVDEELDATGRIAEHGMAKAKAKGKGKGKGKTRA